MSNQPYKAESFFNNDLQSEVVRLEHAGADGDITAVEIAPERGSNMYRFQSGEHEIIYGDRELIRNGYWSGNFVLWPLPNRVRGKEYNFEGKTISLQDVRRKEGNEPLIHGLVDDKPWSYSELDADESSARVTTSYEILPDGPEFRHYPFPGKLSLEYVLTDKGVRVGYTVENLGTGNMPFGFALHPYFTVLSGLEKTLVTLPANSIMEADKELLPSGRLIPMGEQEYDLRRPTPIKGLFLDHVFTDLQLGTPAVIDYTTLGKRLTLDSSPDFTHMVLYSEAAEEKNFICLENQTGSTDMINLHERAVQTGDSALQKAAHLLVLGAGATHQGYIEYSLQKTAV